jgi:hypothetical protein
LNRGVIAVFTASLLFCSGACLFLSWLFLSYVPTQAVWMVESGVMLALPVRIAVASSNWLVRFSPILVPVIAMVGLLVLTVLVLAATKMSRPLPTALAILCSCVLTIVGFVAATASAIIVVSMHLPISEYVRQLP